MDYANPHDTAFLGYQKGVEEERERIMAAIRAWPDRPRQWADNPCMSPRELEEARYYAVQDERQVCRELAKMIAAGSAEDGSSRDLKPSEAPERAKEAT